MCQEHAIQVSFSDSDSGAGTSCHNSVIQNPVFANTTDVASCTQIQNQMFANTTDGTSCTQIHDPMFANTTDGASCTLRFRIHCSLISQMVHHVLSDSESNVH